MLPLHTRSGGVRLPANSHGSPAPLDGLRVLDLSRVLAGPLCTMILGDLGADVLKVERPGVGDETRHWGPPWSPGTEGRESAYFLAVNRNKRSVTADLSTDQGRDLVRRLATAADVVVENFAPGTMERWTLGYEALAAENPRLVWCAITGYGSVGPDAGRPGYDFAVQARSGWMSVTGEVDGAPMKVGVALVDVVAGQNAAIGVLSALRERERSGRGQRVEISLMDGALAALVNVAQAALVTGSEPGRFGNAHPTIVPYQAFDASDRPIAVAVGNDAQWRRLCAALGRPDLALDPRYATNPARVEHRDDVISALARCFLTAPAAEWLQRLDEVGVPCGPVRSVSEALGDPGFAARGGLWEIRGPTFGSVRTVATPIRLSRTPGELRRPPPALGEHDPEVRDHGWTPPAGGSGSAPTPSQSGAPPCS
jgi:crotonobetainyl-CoA:carnitine CoA-transferase CaiB-like acyl-CoA transferase